MEAAAGLAAASSGEDVETSEYDDESDLDEEREAASRAVGGGGAAGKCNSPQECPRVCMGALATPEES
jgi:hypothetical protein